MKWTDDDKDKDDDKRYIPSGHGHFEIIDPKPIKCKIKRDIDISVIAIIIGFMIYLTSLFYHDLKVKELHDFDKLFNAGFYDG